MNHLIGNTPMIKIRCLWNDEILEVYVKLEYYNLTGSIKDRMAYYIVKDAYQKGILKKDMPIIEATSGNTGISFAALGAKYGNPVYIFMPDWCSKERKLLMESYGATVFLVSKEEGGFQECIKRADRLSEEVGGFRPNQFSNMNNVRAHEVGTAEEILTVLPDVFAFTSGIGTGGTLIGVGKALKERNKNVKVIALEPSKMALLSGGCEFTNHEIEGIGDDFIPELVDQSLIDEIYQIDDKDAINMSRLLATKLGLGVGISSGANFLSAVRFKQSHQGKIVTVFPDDNKKYLSTNLIKSIDYNSHFLSNQITLLDYEIIT